MQRADLSDILSNGYAFDAAWYRERHPDVGLSGLSPEAHFLTVGHRIGRGISAAHPQLADLPRLARALTARPVISYCIPVMNRPDDIRGTLPVNLAETQAFRDQVEIIVMFFDDDTETHDWIRARYGEDLADGHLRLVVSDALDTWHFGKAKNAFRGVARGRIYSSLDGDNYVTSEETAQLLELAEAYPEGFLFHHFSGLWGDGSCGRVSLPAELYRQIGYDPEMMPRQYDEVDLILSCLSVRPDLPLLRYDTANHGLSSSRSTAFMKESGIENAVVTVPPVRRLSPLNPHSEDYVTANEELQAMQEFNQAQCFLKNTPDRRLQSRYVDMAVTARHQVIDVLRPSQVLETVFWTDAMPRVEVLPGEICLFACMRDDHGYLPAFVAHFRARGVAHIFVVDDRSDPPLDGGTLGPEVHVFRPKVGTFRTAKGLWLEALMKAHLETGMWALTVDADEFVDVPAGFDGFPALAAHLERDTAAYAPGLLVDMLPRSDATLVELAEADTQFETLFNRHLDLRAAPSAAYRAHHSIDWGFGPYARLSWSVDARHQAFGTFDSLRKIPLVRYRPRQHLNQGLHTLHFTDLTEPPGPEIWEAGPILPIRHYNFAKQFSVLARARLTAKTEAAAYHPRTAENIGAILETEPETLLATLKALPARAYADGALARLEGAVFYAPAPDLLFA